MSVETCDDQIAQENEEGIKHEFSAPYTPQ
jgi:hypothetical protein